MDPEIQQMQQEFARWIQLSWESIGRDGRAPAEFIWPDALAWVKKKALSLVTSPEPFGWHPSRRNSDRSTSRCRSPTLRKRSPPLDSQREQIATSRRDHETAYAHITEEHHTGLSTLKRKRAMTPSVEECMPSSKRDCRRLIVVLKMKSGKCADSDRL